ncbi:MAG: phytoene desaturase family protein [Spirochaetaceae bacterium]
MSGKSILVIGAGFGGLSAAAYLAKEGYEVTVVEKNGWPGGRAQAVEQDGYRFDMGPSWYWMPEEHDRWFRDLGYDRSKLYGLSRVDPSYTVFYGDPSVPGERRRLDVPANVDGAAEVFEQVEGGAGAQLRAFLDQSKAKYDLAMNNFIYKNFYTLFDFVNWTTIRNLGTLNILKNYRSMIRRYISHPDLQKILEFPVVFLGSSARNTPAMYTLMNHIDFNLGTWYPDGGFSGVADAMRTVCADLGVKFVFNCEVTGLVTDNGRVTRVQVRDGCDTDELAPDVVVANADYPHVELELLPESARSIPARRWDRAALAPAVVNYYIGLNRKLDGLAHHTFFFDADWDEHFSAVYEKPRWIDDPLFYIHIPSKTDPDVAPEGGEALFILVPAAPGLEASELLRKRYFDNVMDRMEAHTGMSIRDSVVVYRDYSLEEFRRDYNAYKGNAFGLGQTLFQTAYFRPSNKSRKLSNLYYAGQFTVPGTGTTMSTISGRVVTDRIKKEHG